MHELMNKSISSSSFKKFPREASKQLVEWIKSDEERVIWSGNTFEKEFTLDSFLKHLRRSDLVSFSYFTPHDRLLTYGEIVSEKSGVGCLCRVIVNPIDRSKGLGQRFCKDLLLWMKSEGKFSKAVLNTFAYNHQAINCYSKVGFKIVSRKPKSRKVSGVWMDTLVMSKRI